MIHRWCGLNLVLLHILSDAAQYSCKDNNYCDGREVETISLPQFEEDHVPGSIGGPIQRFDEKQ